MKRDKVYRMYEVAKEAKDNMPEIFKPAIEDFLDHMEFAIEHRGSLLSDVELERIINLLLYTLSRKTTDYDGQ